jgi:hypothetical protein
MSTASGSISERCHRRIGKKAPGRHSREGGNPVFQEVATGMDTRLHKAGRARPADPLAFPPVFQYANIMMRHHHGAGT